MARTNRTNRMRLGELLVAAGLVTEEKVRAALEEQRRNNLFLGEALVRLGFVTEEAIAHAIIQHFNLPFLSASQFTIPPDVFNLFPERMYHEYQFIAVDKIDTVIIIVAAGPINQDMMEELQRVSGCKICHYVSTWNDIHGAIARNSQELGGQAQIELTGLGSMLLDAPAPQPSMGASMGGSKNNVGVSIGPSSISSIFKPGESIRLGQAPRTTMVPKSKILNATNLSQLISPLSQATQPNISEAPAGAVPPSPRLTAFLKAQANSAGHSNASSPALQAYTRSSGSMPSIQASASNGSMGAVPGLSSTRPAPPAPQVPPNSQVLPSSVTSRVSVPPSASNSGIVAIPDDPNLPPRPKRLSSFTNVRKPAPPAP